VTVVRAPRLFYGWVVVAAVFVVLFFGFGAAYSFGAFFESMQAEFAATRASISFVFALAAFAYFLVGAGAGTAADRFGPRWIVIAGMVVTGLGLVLASRASTLLQVYAAYAAGMGVGVGLAYVPAVGATQRWFIVSRGRASGWASAGIGVGTLCVPIFAAWLIETSDWRTAYLIIGLAVLVGGGGAALLIEASPERRGLVPDGAARPAVAISRSEGLPEALGLFAAVRSRPFIALYGALLLTSLGNFVPFVHLVPYARDHGIDQATSVVLLGLLGVGSALGRFVVGPAADRFGRKRSLGLAYAGLGLSCVWWLVSDQVWQLAVFALVMGTCYGGFVALLPAVMADYFGVRAVSGIVGVLYTACGVGTLVGPTLAGAAFDHWQSYVVPIGVSAVAALAAAAVVFAQQSPDAWRSRMRETVARVAPAG
jgi:MFS family permease